jgi:hypothetical protein
MCKTSVDILNVYKKENKETISGIENIIYHGSRDVGRWNGGS